MKQSFYFGPKSIYLDSLCSHRRSKYTSFKQLMLIPIVEDHCRSFLVHSVIFLNHSILLKFSILGEVRRYPEQDPRPSQSSLYIKYTTGLCQVFISNAKHMQSDSCIHLFFLSVCFFWAQLWTETITPKGTAQQLNAYITSVFFPLYCESMVNYLIFPIINHDFCKQSLVNIHTVFVSKFIAVFLAGLCCCSTRIWACWKVPVEEWVLKKLRARG